MRTKKRARIKRSVLPVRVEAAVAFCRIRELSLLNWRKNGRGIVRRCVTHARTTLFFFFSYYRSFRVVQGRMSLPPPVIRAQHLPPPPSVLLTGRPLRLFFLPYSLVALFCRLRWNGRGALIIFVVVGPYREAVGPFI